LHSLSLSAMKTWDQNLNYLKSKMMKWKKLILALIGIVVILFLSRNWLFNVSTQYQSIGQRDLIVLSDQNLIREIELWKSSKESIRIDEAVGFALKLTARKLKFSTRSGLNSNPNKIPDSGESNCVGYSKLFNSVATYIFVNTTNLKNCKSTHLVGKISFMGIDLHGLTDKPFWSDHDYNRVINTETREEYFVDPSVFDYLRINYIQWKHCWQQAIISLEITDDLYRKLDFQYGIDTTIFINGVLTVQREHYDELNDNIVNLELDEVVIV